MIYPRLERAASRVESIDDRLPPHDEFAERTLLGSLWSPIDSDETEIEKCAAALKKCLEIFGEEKVFYDLRNEEIWNSLLFVHRRDGKCNVITLQAELKTRGLLDQVGGILYLLDCEKAGCYRVFFDDHLRLVWEKFLARRLIQKNLDQARVVFESGELTESQITNIEERNVEFQRLLQRGTITPKNLCKPNQFGDAYYDQWFNRKEDTFGYELPFEFPMRFRPAATTLMTGDNGSGKSSMLCLFSIVIGRQLKPGEKVVVASMEMPPEVTLWIMARQLMGVGKLDCTEENIARIVKALAWLNDHVLLYNFLGITDKRDLMSTFEYAAQHENGKFFIIDNMMKVGIADDDYAAQGFFIQQVCDFDLKRKVHTVVVVHENKGDGTTKQKVRGSKQLTDAPDNVVKMERNEKKAEKLAELRAELRAFPDKEKEIEIERRKLVNFWDSKFLLLKQRWPGARQNGSAWLYFHHDSLQFHKEPNQQPFDYRLT